MLRSNRAALVVLVLLIGAIVVVLVLTLLASLVPKLVLLPRVLSCSLVAADELLLLIAATDEAVLGVPLVEQRL